MSRKPAPERVRIAIQALHEAFPSWGTRRIGAHVGVSCGTVSRVLSPPGSKPERLDIGPRLRRRQLGALNVKHAQERTDARLHYTQHWSELEQRQIRERQAVIDSFNVR